MLCTYVFVRSPVEVALFRNGCNSITVGNETLPVLKIFLTFANVRLLVEVPWTPGVDGQVLGYIFTTYMKDEEFSEEEEIF